MDSVMLASTYASTCSFRHSAGRRINRLLHPSRPRNELSIRPVRLTLSQTTRVASMGSAKRPTSRTPLMSFSSPSALASCDAPSGAAGLRTIPLRRCSLACDPRVRYVVGQRRPCGFSPWRMRCGCARWRTCRFGFRNRTVAGTPRLSGLHSESDLSSIVRAGIDRGNRSVTALANDPSHQAI
jgi:hypothetical protein